MVQNAVNDPVKYTTSFGYSGTYWDYVKEIAQERSDLKTLLNLDIRRDEIEAILNEAGFSGYRFSGALAWIMKTIDMIKAI